MEVIKDLANKALAKYDTPQEINDLLIACAKIDLTVLLVHECFQALLEIRAIVAEESYSDFVCVESIVQVLEGIGLDCGDKYDY